MGIDYSADERTGQAVARAALKLVTYLETGLP
jgi:hypothetical protein